MDEQLMKEYFNGIDKLMSQKGYTLGVISGQRTNHETRQYSQNPRLDGTHSRVIIEVRKDKEFRFYYSCLPMCAQLSTGWMSPITSSKHFDKMMDKFNKSVTALRKEWNDF